MVWVEVALAPLVAIFKTFWVLEAAAVEVTARFTKLPEVREEEAAEMALPVFKELAVRENTLVLVAAEVREMAPEVAVMLTAPVVTVKPLEAVSKPAEVMVPVEVVLMLPEVVMASPALVGWRTLGPVVLSHQP